MPPVSEFKLSNLSFIKYFYRNVYSLFLLPTLGFIFILVTKENITLIGTIIIAVLALLLLTVFFMTSKYLKLENGCLTYIYPLMLKSCKYDINNIEHVNSKVISTGRGGIKNLTIELVDKRIITLRAGLNTQRALDQIADELNTRSSLNLI